MHAADHQLIAQHRLEEAETEKEQKLNLIDVLPFRKSKEILQLNIVNLVLIHK